MNKNKNEVKNEIDTDIHTYIDVCKQNTHIVTFHYNTELCH